MGIWSSVKRGLSLWGRETELCKNPSSLPCKISVNECKDRRETCLTLFSYFKASDSVLKIISARYRLKYLAHEKFFDRPKVRTLMSMSFTRHNNGEQASSACSFARKLIGIKLTGQSIDCFPLHSICPRGRCCLWKSAHAGLTDLNSRACFPSAGEADVTESRVNGRQWCAMQYVWEHKLERSRLDWVCRVFSILWPYFNNNIGLKTYRSKPCHYGLNYNRLYNCIYNYHPYSHSCENMADNPCIRQYLKS